MKIGKSTSNTHKKDAPLLSEAAKAELPLRASLPSAQQLADDRIADSLTMRPYLSPTHPNRLRMLASHEATTASRRPASKGSSGFKAASHQDLRTQTHLFPHQDLVFMCSVDSQDVLLPLSFQHRCLRLGGKQCSLHRCNLVKQCFHISSPLVGHAGHGGGVPSLGAAPEVSELWQRSKQQLWPRRMRQTLSEVMHPSILPSEHPEQQQQQ